MKKVLKYQVKKVDMNGVHFVVTEQSHLGEDFGDVSPVYHAKNGVVLQSCSYPAWSNEASTLYVRGEDLYQDEKIVTIPFERAKDVFMAIEEYNQYKFLDNINIEAENKAWVEFDEIVKQMEELENKLHKLLIDNPKLAPQMYEKIADELEKKLLKVLK